MWCSLCRSDVSVRTTGHAGGLLCSRCGQDLISAAKPTEAIRHAREILERWNSSDLFERISRTESLDSLPTGFDAILKPGSLKQSLAADVLDSAAPRNAHAATEIDDSASISPESVPTEFTEAEDTEIGALQTTEIQSALVEVHPIKTPETEDLTSEPNSRTDLILYESNDSDIMEPETQSQDDEHEDAPSTGIGLETVSKPGGRVSCRAETLTTDNSAEASPAHRPDLKQPLTPDEPFETEEQEASTAVVATSPAPVARVFDLTQFTHIGVIGLTTVANVRKISDRRNENSAPANLAQSLIRVADAVTVNQDDSEQGPPKPAESANVSELLTSAVPKKIPRSNTRRPLLHRRFQMERPPMNSSTGSETVNRNLRVDQPGGINDAPKAAQQDTAIASSVAPETKLVSNSPRSGKRFRIDGPESVDAVTGTDGRRARTQTLPKQRYIDDAHESNLRGPHFEVSTPRRSNLTSVTGQFLAYIGVLGLTIGTAMVIYGHFGGYSEYTPTGWLVTTVAQMLLFLGVINLVSGGIEQNNDDVSRRINSLGEQLFRIEQVTSEVLKGPKISAHRYDNPDAVVEESAREAVDLDRR